ncbi:MAG: HAMP domain-containing protein [Desulfobacterales bacterium]|nr:HAMP domain-containing protein [Desulfobacterales bacterium]
MDNTVKDLQARSEILLYQFKPILFDGKILDDKCKQIGKASSTRITVILPLGKVIGDSDENPDNMEDHSTRYEIKKALKGDIGVSTRYSPTLKLTMMYVAKPIFGEDKKILGALRVSIPVSAIYERLSLIQSRIIFIGLIAVFFAAIIGWIIARRISLPIEEIQKGSDNFAKGNLDYNIFVQGAYEVVSLADSMNLMASNLNDKIKTVKSQRNELQTILSTLVEAVIAIDMHEKIISFNNSALKMLQIKDNNLKGRILVEAIRSSEMERFVKKAFISVIPLSEVITVQIKDEVILKAYSAPLNDDKDIRIGTVFFLYDITRLVYLENIRRDFTLNILHEIKTPVTAIKGFIETIQDNPSDDPQETQKFFNIISRQFDRLIEIVEVLVSLSKIEDETEKNIIELKEYSLNEVIIEAINKSKEKADGKDIKIEFNPDNELSAKINPKLLCRAILNLFDNAIKYSKQGGYVDVSIYKHDSEILINLKDQGIGIEQEHIPRIFERFYRIDKSRSRERGGAGLGLAIVKHIINAHGGYISVESNVGKGSLFTIHIPKLNSENT